MPDRYVRRAVPGYVEVELVLDEELFWWADAYAAGISASVEAAIEAALKQYRGEHDGGAAERPEAS